MNVIEDLLAGALGYGVASATDSKVVGDVIDNVFKSMTLEDMIKNYARKHRDIYSRNNNFAKELHDIARSYEEYDYNDIYGE